MVSSGEVTLTGGLAAVSVPLFRSLDAAVKHRLGPVLAALKVWETSMRSHSTNPREPARDHRISVKTYPLLTWGLPVTSLVIGQGVEEAPGHSLTNVALDERSNCLIRSHLEQGF